MSVALIVIATLLADFACLATAVLTERWKCVVPSDRLGAVVVILSMNAAAVALATLAGARGDLG